MRTLFVLLLASLMLPVASASVTELLERLPNPSDPREVCIPKTVDKVGIEDEDGNYQEYLDVPNWCVVVS